MRKKHWLRLAIIIGLLTVFTFGAALLGLKWQQQSIARQEKDVQSRMQPVFLVPGSSATQDRFDALISLLNKNTSGHSLLKVTVQTDSKLKISGAIRRNDNQPFIVVGFQNNNDGYSNIKKQAAWFAEAFKALQKTYRFNRFLAIGHSNGGLNLTIFLEKYLPKNTTIARMMTIASPYNLEENTTNKTQMLKDLIADKEKLPSNLSVYSIAGTENYSGDGTVPFVSVDSGKYIFQDIVKHYTEIIVTGANATHTDLVQNQQIVNLIREYILQENLSNAIRQRNREQPRVPTVQNGR